MFGVAIQSMEFVVAAYNSGRIWLPGNRELVSEYEHLQGRPENDEAIDIEERKAWGLFEKSSIRRRFSIGRQRSESVLGSRAPQRAIELAVLKPGQAVDCRNASAAKKRRSSGNDTEKYLNHQSSV